MLDYSHALLASFHSSSYLLELSQCNKTGKKIAGAVKRREELSMEEILVMISSYGFPMVMAVYLLVRIEPLIRGLKESVDSLSLLVAMQSEIKARDLEKYQIELLKEK